MCSKTVWAYRCGTLLRPITLDDLKDDLKDNLKDNPFVQHDLNLFNFVIYLNRALQEQGRSVEEPPRLDLSMVNPCPVQLADMPHGKLNFIDLQTAIEIFTPTYQLLLNDNDFWRASNSLQLDETIGIYCARLTGLPEHLVLLNDKHPLVPESTLRAGYRLLLHGLSTEMLHGLLLGLKERQAARQSEETGRKGGPYVVSCSRTQAGVTPRSDLRDGLPNTIDRWCAHNKRLRWTMAVRQFNVLQRLRRSAKPGQTDLHQVSRKSGLAVDERFCERTIVTKKELAKVLNLSNTGLSIC